MKLVLLSSLFALALSTPAFAQDVKKGETIFKTCTQCHGQHGEGMKSQEAPRIAGQHDWYIVTQLQSFKSKKRSNPKMYPFISGLSEQDFKDVAAFLASLK